MFSEQNTDPLVAPDGYVGPGTYTMRVGLSERWDAAASVGMLLVGGEAKYNFLRSRVVDAAAVPRAQYYQPVSYSGASLTTVSFGVPWGVNVTPWMTFIAAPALAYAYGHVPASYDADTDTRDPSEHEQGAVAALGTDVGLRLTNGLAIQPGFTLYRPLARDEYRWQVGLGFNFGALPGARP